TEVRNHLGRAAGKIDNWNLSLRQPINDPVYRLPVHNFLPLWLGVHMAMHARQIAKLAYVHLKNFRAATTKRDRVLRQFLCKTVHLSDNSPPSIGTVQIACS